MRHPLWQFEYRAPIGRNGDSPQGRGWKLPSSNRTAEAGVLVPVDLAVVERSDHDGSVADKAALERQFPIHAITREVEVVLSKNQQPSAKAGSGFRPVQRSPSE